jgi:hypothetical protein
MPCRRFRRLRVTAQIDQIKGRPEGFSAYWRALQRPPELGERCLKVVFNVFETCGQFKNQQRQREQNEGRVHRRGRVGQHYHGR